MGRGQIVSGVETVHFYSEGKQGSACGRGTVLTSLADQVTCKRCLRSHIPDEATHEPTLKEVFDSTMSQMDEVFGQREVRTTSSTGGQKGVKEARYSLIPIGPLEDLAVLFGRGARKYDVHQWRKGYELSKVLDAMQRHQSAFWAGKDFDVCSNDPAGCQFVDADGNPFDAPAPDTCYNHTGAHHLTAVAWHAFVMRELVETHPEHDDRYIIKE
jgi:hypothetical protein